MPQYNPTPQEEKIIEIMRNEVSQWREGQVYVTPKAHYKMRNIIQKARKNYLGVFDRPYDEITRRKKIFIPLTEDMVETIVKNIDLDSVDINIRATNPDGFHAAAILRYLLSYYMRRTYFGELLNELLRLFSIDGTIVVKTLKNYDKLLNGQSVKSSLVDVTNFYIDPSEKDIQSAGSVIERNILKFSELLEYPWDNKEYVIPRTDIARLDTISNTISQFNRQVPYVEVYERWGDLPKWVFTGRKEDMDVWIPSVAIVSNLFTNPVVHKYVINNKKLKPYEESRFRKIFGRWHGRGVGEILLGLQSYLNEIANLRLNKSRLSQLGLFKFRKGSGINQQMIASLASGGAIPVTRMDDIQELRISDIQPSSYKDEEVVYNWSQRVTGAWNIGRGEALPASQPATTAVLQERGMQSGISLLQENLGMFLSRVFERHIIPLLLQTIKDDELVSIIGSPKELKEIDEAFINYQVRRAIINSYAQGKGYPPLEYLENLKNILRQNLKRFSKTRYFRINKKALMDWQYEVQVFVTGESFNKAVMVRQLNDLLINYSRIPGINLDPDAVVKELLDLMGLGGARFLKERTQTSNVIPSNVQLTSPTPVRPLQETEQTGETITAEAGGRGETPTLK